MQRWDNLVRNVQSTDPTDLETFLDAEGENGYELVSVIKMDGNNGLLIFLKRPKISHDY